jgi:DNA polymerase I
MRSLIKPVPGCAVAYLDYEQQEIAVAAALSEDPHMQADYLSGDFYIGFGKRAGHIPPEGTKKTHEKERDTFKVTSLGINYDMQGPSLGKKINQPTVYANELLQLHHELYSVYWEWSERIMDQAVTKGVLQTVMGWKIRTPGVFNPRSIRNFMMQAHGAELLRLACCLATEAGLNLCGPLHDALFIESPIDHIEEHVEQLKAFMRKASRIVLAGFECRVEAKIFEYPKRYRDKRGVKMWNTVMDLIGEPDEKFEQESSPGLDKSQRSELAGSDTDRRSSDRSVFGLRAQEATGTQ